MIVSGGVSGAGSRPEPYYRVADAPLSFQNGEILINPKASLPAIKQALWVLIKKGTHTKDGITTHTKGAITLKGRTWHQLIETISALAQRANGPGAKPIVLGELTDYTINSKRALNLRVQTAGPYAKDPFARKSTIDFMADQIGNAVDRLLGKKPLA
jgi:hypothetical protein